MSKFQLSERLSTMAKMHGLSGRALCSHYNVLHALDSKDLGAGHYLWSNMNENVLQNPTLPIASHANDPGITFVTDVIKPFFHQDDQHH